MRKIIYTCDRCDAEIEGASGVIRVMERDENGFECGTDAAEVAAFFNSPSEREDVEDALAPGWDPLRGVRNSGPADTDPEGRAQGDG